MPQSTGAQNSNILVTNDSPGLDYLKFTILGSHIILENWENTVIWFKFKKIKFWNFILLEKKEKLYIYIYILLKRKVYEKIILNV